jgi:phage shock protein PspC (stress-responsive transcriptional regulator)
MSAPLVRPRNGRIIAGVCAGLGQRFDISPNVVRLIFLLLLILPGPSIIAYGILWVLMPSEP